MQPIDDELEVQQDIAVDREMNAADRCDVCGAQAYIRVVLASGELMFCSHHGNEKRQNLESIALSWHDESEKLLAR